MIAKPVLPGDDVYLRFRVCPEGKTERTPRNLETKGTLKGIFWTNLSLRTQNTNKLANSQDNKKR